MSQNEQYKFGQQTSSEPYKFVQQTSNQPYKFGQQPSNEPYKFTSSSCNNVFTPQQTTNTYTNPINNTSMTSKPTTNFTDSNKVLEILTELKNINQDMLNEIKKKKNHIIHYNTFCNNCKINNITGIRYKCTICSDYDLCEDCESYNLHNHHIFLKIKEPSIFEEFLKIMCPQNQQQN